MAVRDALGFRVDNGDFGIEEPPDLRPVMYAAGVWELRKNDPFMCLCPSPPRRRGPCASCESEFDLEVTSIQMGEIVYTLCGTCMERITQTPYDLLRKKGRIFTPPHVRSADIRAAAAEIARKLKASV